MLIKHLNHMAIEGENIVIVINMVIIMCNPVMKKL